MSKMKRHMESRSLEDIVQELMSVVSIHMDTYTKTTKDLMDCIKALAERIDALERVAHIEHTITRKG